ncbi:unnamed protein product [Brassica oleracea]
MNATKFVVLLFIGVVCANVCARQFEAVSQETKSVISIHATTNGIGAAPFCLHRNYYSRTW